MLVFFVCRSGGQSKDGRGKFAFGSAAADAEEAEKDPGAAIAALDISEDEAEVVVEEEDGLVLHKVPRPQLGVTARAAPAS